MLSNPKQTTNEDTANVSLTQETTQANSSVTSQGNLATAYSIFPDQPLPLQSEFNQIVDVVSEWQRGNFLPGLHCLRYSMIPKDFLDDNGYNPLHHAVSQGSIPTVIVLLDHFKIDVNLRSKSGQTPLMIACNYGFNEIIRILVERGANTNAQDNTKFSALLYCVKQNRIPQLAYLLHRKADTNVRDSNGCTVLHWAAYQNNVFLLKLFKRLEMNLNILDFSGMTPLDRAVQSDAFDAVHYLIKHGDGKVPSKLSQVPGDMKEILRKKYTPTNLEALKESLLNTYLQNSQSITLGTYAVLWVLMTIVYLHVVMGKGFSYAYNIIFLAFDALFALYALWYYFRSNVKFNKIKTFAYSSLPRSRSTDDSLQSTIPKKEIKYEALEKLIRKEPQADSEEDTEGFPSFLHEIAWLYETDNFKELLRFDQKNFCPVCLIRKPPRSAHHDEGTTCVAYFHHYSYALGRSIDHRIHYLYLILVIMQHVVLSLFLIGVWGAYGGQIENKKIWFVEAAYWVFTDYGAIYTVVYGLFLVLALYSFVFTWMELYSVARNITDYELFNRTECPYLYKIRQEKGGNFVKYFDNPYDLGMKENVKQYIKNRGLQSGNKVEQG